VQIHISLTQVEPPAGTLWLQPGPGMCDEQLGEEVTFTGWLGLIRVLSHLIGAPRDPGDAA
jgi:hypothetical protein